MRPFFICALPRSRTAWMANFLTYGPSFCFHEALIHCRDVADLKQIFARTGRGIVGNSDTANAPLMPAILAQFPDARIVVIDRPIEESSDALLDIGFSADDALVVAAAAIEEIKERHDPMVVRYHELDANACEAIWRYCVGAGFSKARWEMLNDFNIQIFPDRLRQRVSNNAENLALLFGARG